MDEDKLIAVPESLLVWIGDAIRTKRDITTPVKVEDMPMEIGLIEGDESTFFGFFTLEQATTEPVTIIHGIGVRPTYMCVLRHGGMSTAGTNMSGIYISPSICNSIVAYSGSARVRNYSLYRLDDNSLTFNTESANNVVEGLYFWFATVQ